MRTARAVRLVVLSLAVPALACKPAEKKLTDALESSASWAATAEEVAAGWMKHDHPVPYTKDSLKAAREDLAKARKTIRKTAAVAPAGAENLVARADVAIREMSEAVDRADSAAVAAKRAELFDIEKRLRAMADRARAGS